MDSTIEAERKRRLPDDGGELAARLEELGWTPDVPVSEVYTYYSRPDVDYMQTVECLRVRRRGDFAEITCKPPSTAATHSADGVISKVETNVRLAAAEHEPLAHQLLENIGMRPSARVEKSRTAYHHPLHPDATVSIDVVAGVGTFVETEIISADATRTALSVEQTEKTLGVADLPVVDAPYRDLALAGVAAS